MSDDRELIDRIRDGVTASELDGRGRRAIFNLLVSTAMSALQRDGWDWPRWHAELSSATSNLGRQVRIRRDRDIGKHAFDQELLNAWQRAELVIAAKPRPWTGQDVHELLVGASESAETIDPENWPLLPQDLIVFRFAIYEAIRIETTSPTLALRVVGAHLIATLGQWAASDKLTEWAARDREDLAQLSVSWARRSLERLTDAGLLDLRRAGRSGNGYGSSGRATVYRISREVLDGTHPHIHAASAAYVPKRLDIRAKPEAAVLPNAETYVPSRKSRASSSEHQHDQPITQEKDAMTTVTIEFADSTGAQTKVSITAPNTPRDVVNEANNAIEKLLALGAEDFRATDKTGNVVPIKLQPTGTAGRRS